MKPRNGRSVPHFALFAAVATPALLCSPAVFGQGADDQDTVLVLSPFEVNTSTDSGYYASNAISGTRVNVPIKDIPLSIEVVTSEFIEDTGSGDLRESLRYSAGIVLQSQNDAMNAAAFDDVGGVNNPEGVTNNKTQTSFKMRGFVTDNVLRNGFRRQHATDSINIDRIEVVRGPSALLYGIGNFGGVINYVVKQPMDKLHQSYEVQIGSDNLYRATADVSGPISETWDVNYRITMAAETSDDWTDIKNSEHYFISPIVTFKPTETTKVTVDFEYGEQTDEGVSFQSVRTPTIEDIPVDQPDRMQTYGFLEFDDKDVRTFRWSGPDTYVETKAVNAFIQVEQHIFDGLDALIGYNYNKAEYDTRDVFGALVCNTGPQDLWGTVRARQIINGTTADDFVEVDNVVFQYNWSDNHEENTRDQFRAELNYKFDLLQDKGWFASSHNLLYGFSYEESESDIMSYNSADWNWKSPLDSSYIRFDVQGDGSPSSELEPNTYKWTSANNAGNYLVYSGRFLKDRLFVIAGIRRDKNSVDTINANLREVSAPFEISESPSVSTDSTQFGVSLELLEGFSVFALRSEGINPNFDGAVDGYGNALPAAKAVSKEAGIKFDLFDGKISGTVSAFKIERTGVPASYWWAPYPAWGQFDPDADIVYRMDDFNAADPAKADNLWLQSARSEWDSAVASGAVFEAVNPNDGETYTYINASSADGAAYLDKVFETLNAEYAKPYEERVDAWPGWLYTGTEVDEDPNVNTASEDWSSHGASQSISDSSEGYEAQLLFTPNENIQILLNYSHTTRQIDDAGNFAQYPYNPDNWDRWAVWYFPNGSWGLSGVQPEDAYPGGSAGLPNIDTNSWAGIGYGTGESLDDTPKDAVSSWATYRFTEGVLNGFQVGLGVTWESKREYASAFTTTRQLKLNDSGTKIQAWTDPRYTVNLMLKYSRTLSDKYDFTTQLNIDNLLDDEDQYGLIYAPGMSWRWQMGISF
ncbi:MAG: TonB-dependent receptor plug domain-containing protein [Opitutales bacterium]|nr:TonB-dependent receptor plug domain-containing protein [Opitutales bacterium]